MSTLSIVLLVCAALYFLPTLIGWQRDMGDQLKLFLLNLFLGWTLLGWFAALLWGALGQTRAQRLYYEQASARLPR